MGILFTGQARTILYEQTSTSEPGYSDFSTLTRNQAYSENYADGSFLNTMSRANVVIINRDQFSTMGWEYLNGIFFQT